MESESFENQLERQPEPDKDHSKAGITEQNEKDESSVCNSLFSSPQATTSSSLYMTSLRRAFNKGGVDVTD